MTDSTHGAWQMALKEPFEAFGILYYPLFRTRADLAGLALDDSDMAWAVTANANLEGTGYTLSQSSVLTLAAYHHKMAELTQASAFLPLADAADKGVNPLVDLQRLVPSVTAAPMYPDFPLQVMEMSEAQFRYDQMCHYLSTYGVELVAGLLGLDVTVGKGWLPKTDATPKTERDETLVAPKVLHVIMTVEDMRSVVAERLTRATRMHPAEIATTLLVFSELSDEELASFPKVAFHENMMELIYVASKKDSATLERVAAGLAQHPGDLLKAVVYVLENSEKNHLKTRQKKGFCRAFEHFDTMAIARNIAEAGRKPRHAPTFLSVDRFGGPHLREAVELVATGKVRSWTSELELLWDAVKEAKKAGHADEPKFDGFLAHLLARFGAEKARPNEAETLAWEALLAHYGRRPGMLLRSLGRLVKGGCPDELLQREALAHADSYSLPTLVRTLTQFSDKSHLVTKRGGYADFSLDAKTPSTAESTHEDRLCEILRPLVVARMRTLETPLKGKRIFLDTAGVSLAGSVLMPNETGDTGTAWPPVGIAYDLPADKCIRFFTFWDDRTKRVDVDLHFIGRCVDGSEIHVGWNADFRDRGMVTSGDITTSNDSVEYLNLDMRAAREAGVAIVVQKQHIFIGSRSWGDIATCYSGALLVGSLGRSTVLYNPENLLFRDDLTGKGTNMDYAVINVPDHYVRILRGSDMPIGDVGFSLGSYLESLFEAQEVTLVATPEEAELCVCVGRSDDPEVVSLFDEGFYLG